MKRLKERARGLLDEARAVSEEMTDEDRDFVDKFKILPLDEVEHQLAQNQAKADMILQTNPGVIEAYRQRQKQIEEWKEKLKKDEEDVDTIRSSISSLKVKVVLFLSSNDIVEKTNK